MINFDVVDFNEHRSEEVISLAQCTIVHVCTTCMFYTEGQCIHVHVYVNERLHMRENL